MTNEELRSMVDSLNPRQVAYLLAAYDIDQQRAAGNRGIGSSPARVWRWIEYGPDAARKTSWDGPLRSALVDQGLVDAGSGSTWNVLKVGGLVEAKYEETRLFVKSWSRLVNVLFIRLTRDGRKAARMLRGEPLTKPKVPKPLTLTALRLLEWGQLHPGRPFAWSAPWESSGWMPDYLHVLAISRGLRARGLIVGDASGLIRLTEAGSSLNVAEQPNWRARRHVAA